MSLPLTIRKNIKDYEEKTKESLEKLNEAGLGEWEFESDYADVYNTLKAKNKDSSYIERIGEAVFWYLEATANSMVSFSGQSALQKEAIIESVKSRKIIFRLLPAKFKPSTGTPYLNNYVRGSVEKDAFVISVPAENFGSNVDSISESLDTAFDTPGVMPLMTRKNIADNQVKVDEALEKIKEETGVEWEFDCDYAEVHKTFTAKNKDSDWGRRLGEAVNYYVEALANAIQYFCKDPLQKEALLEGAPNHKITLRLVPTVWKTAPTKSGVWGNYARTYVEGGNLSIQVPIENFCSNVDSVGDTLQVCFDDPNNPMTLLARKNIAKYQTEKDENLEKIKAATGVEFEFEVDYGQILAEWKKAVKDISPEQMDRIGEMMESWYLGGLASNIERVCKDEMGKEAFVEMASKKVIRIQIAPALKKGEDSFYNRCKFQDGVLVNEILISNIGSNVDSAGDNIDKLL